MAIGPARVIRRALLLVCSEWTRAARVLFCVVLFAGAASGQICPAGQTVSSSTNTCTGSGVTCPPGGPLLDNNLYNTCCPAGQSPVLQTTPTGIVYTGACCPSGQTSMQRDGSCLPQIVVTCQAGQNPANGGCCRPGEAVTNTGMCCQVGHIPKPDGSCGLNPCAGQPANFGWNAAVGACMAVCPEGQMAIPGSNSCVCPNDLYPPKNGSCNRNPCPQGQRLNFENLCQQVACPPGFTIDTATNSCQNTCPPPLVPNPRNAEECGCPGGASLDQATKTCSCPGGLSLVNGRCGCPAGSVQTLNPPNQCCPVGQGFGLEGGICVPCTQIDPHGNCTCPQNQLTSLGQCCVGNQMASGGMCITPSQNIPCTSPTDTQLADGECCPPAGQGACYTPSIRTGCPSGSRERDGQCVPATTPQLIPIPPPTPPPPRASDTSITCMDGLVPREAFPGDRACVTQSVHQSTLTDNNEAPAHTRPSGNCRPGYVWREARDGDHVCVTPRTRARIRIENGTIPPHPQPPPQANPAPPPRPQTPPAPANPPTAHPQPSQAPGNPPPPHQPQANPNSPQAKPHPPQRHAHGPRVQHTRPSSRRTTTHHER